FYQAEDGIRAKLVTGVQTCALQISVHSPPQPPLEPPLRGGELRSAPRRTARVRDVRPPQGRLHRRGAGQTWVARSRPRRYAVPRSEERRVGNECRTWGATEAGRKAS